MSRMQEQIRKQPPQNYAGIDVGKDHIDIFIYPAGLAIRVRNEGKAIKAAIRKLRQHEVGLAALEATSKYHRLAHGLLHEGGIAVAVVNPFRSRQFADSIGRLAKTDKIDAHALALFAERMKPEAAPGGAGTPT